MEGRYAEGVRARNQTALVAITGLVVALAGCGPSSFATAERTLRRSIDTVGKTRLVLDLPFALDVRGVTTATTAELTLALVASASTASTARRLADAFAFAVTEEAGGIVKLTVAQGVELVGLDGVATATIPTALELLVGSTREVRVQSMQQAVSIAAQGAVEVLDARGDVTVQGGGTVRVTTRALPASRTRLQATGGLQLGLPSNPSVQIVARSAQGSVQIAHPALPTPIQGLPYGASVNGGLADVELDAGGAITIGVTDR
jgi:hypothetical protein